MVRPGRHRATVFPCGCEAFAASFGGVIVLQNLSLQPVGVSASLSDAFDKWRVNILVDALERGKRKRISTRLPIVTAIMEKPANDVTSQVQNMIAALPSHQRPTAQKDLDDIQRTHPNESTESELKRALAILMMHIDLKSAKEFVGC